MVLQNKTSNYDTDVFTPLIREIEALPKRIREQFRSGPRYPRDRRSRVPFILPLPMANCPTILGQAMLFAVFCAAPCIMGLPLGQRMPLSTCWSLIEQQMGDAFPELKREQKLAFNVIREEENSFLKTLDQGLLLLDTILKGSKDNVLEKAKHLSCMIPMNLYDLTAPLQVNVDLL